MEEMTVVVMLMTTFFGVILPSADVYSDVYFDVGLFSGGYYHNQACQDKYPHIKVDPQPVFASVCLMPILMSWLAVSFQWWRLEKGWSAKLKTLPFLLCQFYPQWRALRVIYYAKWARNPEWAKMKEEWETDIGTLGMYGNQLGGSYLP